MNEQVRVEWGVLPKNHEKRLDIKLKKLLQGIATKHIPLSDVRDSVKETLESELEEWTGGHEQATRACFIAHVFDRMLKTDKGDIYDAVVEILRSLLKETCISAPMDSLLPQSVALSAAFGEAITSTIGHSTVSVFKVGNTLSESGLQI